MAVVPAAEARFEYSVPVVVVGAGACGLTAALTAREAGAEVLVLERDAKPAGSTALSTGLIPAAGTRFQRALGIEDSPALLAADIWRKAKGATDRAIVDAVARASGPTIEWLADRHGVAFKLVEGFLYPGHSVLRMHGTRIAPARTRERALAAARRLGIDIVSSAVATDLYARRGRRVVAVGFARPDGATETVGCVRSCSRAAVRRQQGDGPRAHPRSPTRNSGATSATRAMPSGGTALGRPSRTSAATRATAPSRRPTATGQLGPAHERRLPGERLGERFSNEVRGYSGRRSR
jgi:fumarate reductase flavoprotein subunit